MTFAQPHWLLAGLVSCLLLALLFYLLQKRRRLALENFASGKLVDRLTRNVSRTRRQYKNGLLLLAVMLLFAALARPQYGSEWVDVKRKGIDLLFALDTSKSMLAEDIKPNRLKRAHLAILDFVQRLDGDRVGLLPFAGSSFLMCPLTMDYEAFEQSLAAVTTNIIPRGGTNIAGVIEAASTILTNSANHKILIILTDGENLEGDAIAAAEKYAKEGLTVYTVGVGTSGGELIPVPGGQGYVKDKSTGQYVTSKLDETTLGKIADLTGGIYAPLGDAGEGLESIYQEKLSLIPKEELAERRHKVAIDRFEWPLAGAFVLLVMELLLGERKKNGQRPLLKTLVSAIKRKKTITPLMVLLVLSVHTGAKASPGEDAFAVEDYLGAAEYYREQLETSPDSPELQYNYGASSYKNNMFGDAIEAFTHALKSDDLELQKKAYFNLGNSYFQKGVESQQGDPQATVEAWKQAISSMDSALKLAPEDEKAKNNLTVMKKQLEELEKQMQEQQQNQQNNDKQDNQQDKDKSSQGESSQDEAEKENQQPEDGSQGSDSSNKQQEEDGSQKKDQQQNQPGDENKEGGADEASGSPQPINSGEDDEKSQAQQAEEQAQQDALRQQQGKMTREEAERLLNALKNQEGELNFIPSGSAADKETEKDW